jgi:hypothetical protein
MQMLKNTMLMLKNVLNFGSKTQVIAGIALLPVLLLKLKGSVLLRNSGNKTH